MEAGTTVQITMPQMGDSVTEGTVLEWHKQVGDQVEIDETARFVDEGEVVTAAGVSAGIDMALHLVARLHSRERAREVRRYIQYDPEPPV